MYLHIPSHGDSARSGTWLDPFSSRGRQVVIGNGLICRQSSTCGRAAEESGAMRPKVSGVDEGLIALVKALRLETRALFPIFLLPIAKRNSSSSRSPALEHWEWRYVVCCVDLGRHTEFTLFWLIHLLMKRGGLMLFAPTLKRTATLFESTETARNV